MKNIIGRTLQDDLNFLTNVLNSTKGAGRPFLLKDQAAVVAAVSSYSASIINNTAKPIGLKKGQPKAKTPKAKTTKISKQVALAAPVQPATRDSHEHYYSLYDSRRKIITSELNNLTKKFFGHLCPYCSIDTVTHIDHYLPRSHFPEFSISLQNFVMSCDGCNSKYKREHWGNGLKKRVFHPALDIIPPPPGGIFLEAACKYKNQAIIVKFKINNKWQGSVIERHFILMNINERYIAKATLEEIPKIKNILNAQNSQAAKANELTNFINQQIAANPPNSFLNAFYSSLPSLIGKISAGGL